jgi:hypothetical protein
MSDENEPSKVSLTLFWVIALFAVVIEVASGFIIYFSFKDGWKDSSNFGETFGATNTLFSGLALAGVIYTLYLQKNALEEQRIQFKKSDSDSILTQENRKETLARFDKQINALNQAAEIQAIQFYIKYLEEEIKTARNKDSLKKTRNEQYERLENLLKKT